MAHARDPVVPPSQLRPEIPADLEQVVVQLPGQEARRSLFRRQGPWQSTGRVRGGNRMGRREGRGMVGRAREVEHFKRRGLGVVDVSTRKNG